MRDMYTLLHFNRQPIHRASPCPDLNTTPELIYLGLGCRLDCLRFRNVVKQIRCVIGWPIVGARPRRKTIAQAMAHHMCKHAHCCFAACTHMALAGCIQTVMPIPFICIRACACTALECVAAPQCHVHSPPYAAASPPTT